MKTGWNTLLILIFLPFADLPVYSWNTSGHKLIAQIACNQLNRQTLAIYNKYNKAVDTTYASRSLIYAAPWLDNRSSLENANLLPLHYIDIPFSRDETPLAPVDSLNAVLAIRQAIKVLQDPAPSDYNKGYNLRILLHVVGDIHQPMHAVSEFSKKYPTGDKGGNLFRLSANPVAHNLHAYWDKAAGLLTGANKHKKSALMRRARRIEKLWPCSSSADLNPQHWAKESHNLAVKYAYSIRPGTKPDKKYQQLVKSISKQQLALAGCRLAALLKDIRQS